MAASNRGSQSDLLLIEEFIKDVESTSNQVAQLLKEMRDSEVEFATVKTELRILVQNFKELSALIKDGDGRISILTRMALLEKSIKDIEEWVKKQDAKSSESKKEDTALKLADKSGKWQVYTTLVAGILAVISTVVTVLATIFSK